jgi:hypothetical protein
MTALAGWENFYVIVGSSAGALIGLQFVVMTLIANKPEIAGEGQAGGAFGTPTVVHFGAVLLLSAIVSAPWRGVASASAPWIFAGLAGIVYEIIVVRRMRTQSVYTPQLEDWLFHVLLPVVAYATLAGMTYAARTSANGNWRSPPCGLYGVTPARTTSSSPLRGRRRTKAWSALVRPGSRSRRPLAMLLTHSA